MKKIAILAGAGLLALGSATTAQAQWYPYGWHRHHYHHGYDRSGWNGGALAASLIGGALLGSLVAAAATPAYAYPSYSYDYGYAPAYYAPAPVRVVYRTAPIYGARVVYTAPRRVVRQRVVYSSPRRVVRTRVVRQAYPYAALHEMRSGYRAVLVQGNPDRRVVVRGY